MTRRWPILLYLLPVAAALLLYLPVVRYGFVWDDTIFLRDLPNYRAPGSWLAALAGPFILSPNYFRPLPLLTFMTELRLGGLNPALFHVDNLLIHAANTLLVGALAAALLHARPGRSWSSRLPLAGGLLYALHPVLLEGVVFVSGRFDLLATLCLLLALLADARLTGWVRPLAVGLAFLLAALCKEMAVAFLLVLPLWQLVRRLPRERPVAPRALARVAWQQGDVTVYGAVLLAGLVYLGLRAASLGYLLVGNAGAALPVGAPAQHLLLVGRSLAEYLKVVLWPFTSLSPLHVSPLPLPATSPAGWVSWIAVALVLAGLVYAGRRWPRFAWLMLAALLALLPVSNVLPLELGGGAFVAERFLLFPLALAVLALVALHLDLDRDLNLRLATAGALWLVLCIATIQLVAPNWRDNLTFWQWAAARAPQSAMPFTNLALEHNDRGDFPTGLGLAQQALARDPRDANAWNNAGLAFFGLGRYAEAAEAFAQATENEPPNALFWNNLAGARREQGSLAEAERLLVTEVLPRAPDLPIAHLNLGIVYLRLARPDLAAPALQVAAHLLPPDQAGEAEALLQQVLVEHGDDARVYFNLGVVARQWGELDQARTLFAQAAQLDPNWALPPQELDALR